ncbi:MAG: hypothetical protein OEN23_08995 [Paracoccaceae bacterium]|nr:hypothetical protein [Paracoccaceae bacterium]
MSVGNSIEEALLRDPHSPAHRDRSLGTVAAVLGVWALGAILAFSIDLSPVPAWLVWLIIFVIGVSAGAVATRMGATAARSRRAAGEILAREERAQERAEQLAEFRAHNTAPRDPRSDRDWEIIE